MGFSIEELKAKEKELIASIEEDIEKQNKVIEEFEAQAKDGKLNGLEEFQLQRAGRKLTGPGIPECRFRFFRHEYDKALTPRHHPFLSSSSDLLPSVLRCNCDYQDLLKRAVPDFDNSAWATEPLSDQQTDTATEQHSEPEKPGAAGCPAALMTYQESDLDDWVVCTHETVHNQLSSDISPAVLEYCTIYASKPDVHG